MKEYDEGRVRKVYKKEALKDEKDEKCEDIEEKFIIDWP